MQERMHILMVFNSLFRQVVFIVLACIVHPMVIAQAPSCTLSISGKVIDDHDRTALSFAEVYLPELEKGDVADEEGNFKITDLCAGTWLIRVSHLGCEPIEKRIVLKEDLTIDFKLEHHHEELRELEIIRERPDENVGQARNEIDRDRMERDAGKDVSTMLSRVPGVNVVRTGPTISKPMIHGLYGNRILLLNQGLRQEDQQWGTEHAPSIDPFTSEKITVVKGAAAVQYGSDAMGGVVIMEPVPLPAGESTSGELRANGMSNGRGGGLAGVLQGGSGRWRGLGWRVQGSSRMLGDSHSPNYVLSNTGLREAAGSATVGWKGRVNAATLFYSVFAREMGILRAAHIGNLTDLQQAIERQEPWYVAPFSYSIEAPRQVSIHHLVKAEYAHQLSERDQLIFTYGYQANARQEFDRRRAGLSDLPALDLFMPTHSGDLVFKHWLGKHVHGKAGISGNYQENINIPGTGIRPLIPNFKRSTAGIFILEHFPISENLELEAGARAEVAELQVFKYDQNDQWIRPVHEFRNSALSAGANWGVRKDLRLRFNISTAYRPPHVSELYSEGVHHGSGSIERGDPGLSNERSLKLVADVEFKSSSDRISASITGYHDRISNYIYLKPSGYELTIRGAFPVLDHTATDAILNGVDLMAELALIGNWHLRSRFSMVRGHDQVADGPLFLMPSDRMENALLHRIPKWRKWSNIEFELNSLFVSEQTRFPLDVDLVDPPQGYHLLGAMISMTRIAAKNELRFGLSGTNLLNLAYRDILDRFRYFADARGIDVSFWIRYTFNGKKKA